MNTLQHIFFHNLDSETSNTKLISPTPKRSWTSQSTNISMDHTIHLQSNKISITFLCPSVFNANISIAFCNLWEEWPDEPQYSLLIAKIKYNTNGNVERVSDGTSKYRNHHCPYEKNITLLHKRLITSLRVIGFVWLIDHFFR